jgi:AAA domain
MRLSGSIQNLPWLRPSGEGLQDLSRTPEALRVAYIQEADTPFKIVRFGVMISTRPEAIPNGRVAMIPVLPPPTRNLQDRRVRTAGEVAPVRDAENKMIQLAAEGQGKHEPMNGRKEWVIRNPLVAVSEEQSKAVRHVLGSKDFISSFAGPAGAGKTELMTEAVTAIESLSAKRVMILAPSSPSVEVLRAHGFANAETLQQFLTDRDLQQAAKDQVLWVDEAGFLCVLQMLQLEEFAIEHDCRLAIMDDTKQHHSVQRGDALRILERSVLSPRPRSPRSIVNRLPSYVKRSKI